MRYNDFWTGYDLYRYRIDMRLSMKRKRDIIQKLRSVKHKDQVEKERLRVEVFEKKAIARQLPVISDLLEKIDAELKERKNGQT